MSETRDRPSPPGRTVRQVRRVPVPVFLRHVTMLLLLVSLLLACGTGGGGSGDPGGTPAAADPERESTVPTGWQWWLGRTENEVNSIRGTGNRLIDIEMAPAGGGAFDAVFVQNTGDFARSAGWWFGLSADQVNANSVDIGYRILDLEPYSSGGQRVFTINVVKNEGAAAKDWRWNHDLTAAEVTADINAHGIRLIDLEAYDVGGARRFAYVGIKNEGVDARAWWWYHGVTPAFVTDRINEHGARLLDVETHADGTLSVVLIENDGSTWIWGYGLTHQRVTEMVATTATRIIDLERTDVGFGSTFAFIGLDTANEETRRLRTLLYRAYDPAAFGDVELRGFLVKEVGGATLAEMGGALPFQPYSTLKLLPFLHALIEVDDGFATLGGTTIPWIEATVDNPATPDDERNYAVCLESGAPGTQSNAAPLVDALPTMMWESHNRTLDALLDEYGPDNITNRAKNDLGMTQTEMHYGCLQPGDVTPQWLNNRSTLFDLATLFEGVESMQFVDEESTRTAFFDFLQTWTYTGAFYWSPITGAVTGPIYNGGLRPIVQREAGPAKQGIVEEFLQHVVVRTKGGGVGGGEFGYSGFSHITVPFKQNGQVVLKTYLAGWYLTRLQSPPGCPEENWEDGGFCQALWTAERNDTGLFSVEVFAAPIREALKSWP